MRRNFPSAALCWALAPFASGQIVYELNGNAVPGPNITVATVAGINTLRVYDSGTAVDESIPLITISVADVNSLAGATELRVWTSGQAAFPPLMTTPMTPDVIDFGGISFANDSNSQALRNITRLAVRVLGKITGPCDVGQAFRIEPDGEIKADAPITASAADGFAGFNAVQHVQSSNGPLLGNITAAQGSIGQILCDKGPIGPAPGGAGPSITSAQNIGSIQAQTINAAITAAGDLNFLHATTGGVHGSVEVAGTLWDGSDFHNNDVLVAAAASSAQFQFGGIVGNVVLSGGLTGVPDHSGLEVAGDFNGNLTSSGFVDGLVVHGDYCGTCTGDVVRLGSSGGFGTLAIDGDFGNSDIFFEGTEVLASTIDRFDCHDFFGRMEAFDQFSPLPAVNQLHIRGSVKDVPGRHGFPNSVSMSQGLGTPVWRVDCAIEHGAAVTVQYATDLATGYVGVLDGLLQFSEDIGLGANFIVTSNWTARGVVQVGAYWNDAPPPFGSALLLSADYPAVPNSFGGGAVGVVPFTLHEEACDSFNVDSNGHPSILWSEWSDKFPCHATNDHDIILNFRGPIRRRGNAPEAVPLLKVDFLTAVDTVNGQHIENTDVTQFCDITLDTYYAAVNRQVRISPKPGRLLPWGTYQVRNWRPDLDGRVPPLVCGDLPPGVGEVPVADFVYQFEIGQDCTADCGWDAACPGTLFPVELCDSIDFNNDGVFPDTQDISDFIAVFGGAPCPSDFCNDIDFNNDSVFPDTNDITAFISVMGGGSCIVQESDR